MGVKRGHYRKYLGGKKRKQDHIKSVGEGKLSAAGNSETDEVKIAAGRRMYIMVVYLEKLNHFIGETITIEKESFFKDRSEYIEGKVIGIYPHFLLVDCGEFNTTVSYKDILLRRNKR